MIRIFLIANIAMGLLMPLSAFAEVKLFDRDTIELGEFDEGKTMSSDFTLRNISGKDITITQVQTSCGCTEVTPGSDLILSGEELTFTVSTDTSGKKGLVTKFVEIYTNTGDEPFELKLLFSVNHLPSQVMNSGAIFKGRCATCHIGNNVEEKFGAELYDSLCYMCHKEPSNLPDLNRETFIRSVSSGIRNSSMPGFIASRGGPLSISQIESMAGYYLDHK